MTRLVVWNGMITAQATTAAAWNISAVSGEISGRSWKAMMKVSR